MDKRRNEQVRKFSLRISAKFDSAPLTTQRYHEYRDQKNHCRGDGHDVWIWIMCRQRRLQKWNAGREEIAALIREAGQKTAHRIRRKLADVRRHDAPSAL